MTRAGDSALLLEPRSFRNPLRTQKKFESGRKDVVRGKTVNVVSVRFKERFWSTGRERERGIVFVF